MIVVTKCTSAGNIWIKPNGSLMIYWNVPLTRPILISRCSPRREMRTKSTSGFVATLSKTYLIASIVIVLICFVPTLRRRVQHVNYLFLNYTAKIRRLFETTKYFGDYFSEKPKIFCYPTKTYYLCSRKQYIHIIYIIYRHAKS